MNEVMTASLPQGLCPSPRMSVHVWRFLTYFKFSTGYLNLNKHLNFLFFYFYLGVSKNKTAIMFLPSQWYTTNNSHDDDDDDDVY